MTQRQRRAPPKRATGEARRAAGGRSQRRQRRRRPRRPRPNANAGADEGERRPRGRGWLLALPVVVLVLWLALTNYVFLVRNVEVVGADDVPVADVVRLSGIRLGGRHGRRGRR